MKNPRKLSVPGGAFRVVRVASSTFRSNQTNNQMYQTNPGSYMNIEQEVNQDYGRIESKKQPVRQSENNSNMNTLASTKTANKTLASST